MASHSVVAASIGLFCASVQSVEASSRVDPERRNPRFALTKTLPIRIDSTSQRVATGFNPDANAPQLPHYKEKVVIGVVPARTVNAAEEGSVVRINRFVVRKNAGELSESPRRATVFRAAGGSKVRREAIRAR